MHARGPWGGAGIVNREDCKVLFYRGCLPQVPPPLFFLPRLWYRTGGKNPEEGSMKEVKNLSPYSKPFRPRPRTGHPEKEFMINWIWDWSLYWTGPGIFKYQNRQATKGSAQDILEEGEGSWNRECLKGVAGKERFLSCSLNWFWIDIVEIITVSEYTGRHNCWCHSCVSWKHIY